MLDRSLPRKAPTRNQVAEHAQVSTAVVSYVLTGAKRVSPEKERRVHEAIKELGYVPNTAARALRTGRTHVLALLIPDSSNPYFAEFALQIETAAAERGYALLIANTHDDAENEERLVTEMGSRGVDGLIIASVLQGLRPGSSSDAQVPTVVIDAFHPIEGAPSIGVDAIGSAAEAVRHLVEVHGRRRVALVLGASSDPDQRTDPRQIGWERTLREAGLEPGPIEITGWSREGGLEAAARLLSGPGRPDAVFAGSDLIGIGFLRGAADHGLRIPEDLAVISYDGTSESAFSVPRLTTLQQPVRAMARAAIDAVLHTGPPPKSITTFPGELILRESCGCGAHRAPVTSTKGPPT